MVKFLVIALGGACGALLRYGVSGIVSRVLPAVFPWGTLVVNCSGCLLIGLLWGAFEVVIVSSHIRLFLLIGVLGSFTTFSSFALENFHLLRDGETAYFLVNVFLNVVMGLGLVFFGYFASRFAVNFLR